MRTNDPRGGRRTDASPSVLVPIDFSDCSAEIVERAIEVARPRGARLVLLHVIELPEGATEETPVAGGRGAGAHLEAAAMSRLAEHVRSAAAAGVDATRVIARGEPAEAILAAAEAAGVEQIVLGTHGRTGVSRWLLGSVANRVVRRARQPVEVVRAERKPHCAARSCAWCHSHVTEEQQQVAAELDG